MAIYNPKVGKITGAGLAKLMGSGNLGASGLSDNDVKRLKKKLSKKTVGRGYKK